MTSDAKLFAKLDKLIALAQQARWDRAAWDAALDESERTGHLDRQRGLLAQLTTAFPSNVSPFGGRLLGRLVEN